MKLLIKKYILLLFVTGSLAQNNNFVSINGFSPYNNKFMVEVPNNTNGEEKKSIFDIKSISAMYINDVTNPKIIDTNEFNFDTTPECLNLVKSKYSCVKLESKDFNSFCEKLNSDNCKTLSDNDKVIISENCNINLADAGDFIQTINRLIKAKQFFCIKKVDPKEATKNANANTNDKADNKNTTNSKDNTNSNNDTKNKDSNEKNDTKNKDTNEKNNSCEDDDENGFCPITISLQNGYLKLMKEVEEQNNNVQKRKRSPVISNVNSFLPSSNIDAQIVKKRLVEDLKKNCNYTVCSRKLNEYIREIRDNLSYFNVIYKYEVNDDSLRDNILKILEENNCSGISRKVIISCHIFLIIIGVLYLLI